MLSDDQRARLKRIIELSGTDMTAVSLAANLSKSTVRDIITARARSSRMETFERIAGALGLVVADLLSDEPAESVASRASAPENGAAGSGAVIPMKYRHNTLQSLFPSRDLPLLGEAKTGYQGIIMRNKQPAAFIDRPAELVGVRDAFAVHIVGDSMAPRYFEGELVYIDPSMPVTPGCDVLVLTRKGEAFVKRFVRRDAREVVTDQYNPPSAVHFPNEQVQDVHVVFGRRNGTIRH